LPFRGSHSLNRHPEYLIGNSRCALIFNTKIVVPAQAGTHTPQRLGSITSGEVVFMTTNSNLWPVYHAKDRALRCHVVNDAMGAGTTAALTPIRDHCRSPYRPAPSPAAILSATSSSTRAKSASTAAASIFTTR
jgi:hypothetical protein